MPSGTYLDAIVDWHKKRADHDTRRLSSLVEEATQAGPTRGFESAIRSTPHLAVIAEIKRRSPSKGDLARGLDPAQLARDYESSGATCMSVLTDSEHFAGSPADLADARAACSLPVLRKDFTVDARDVCDARVMGADCVLLIAAVLDAAQLRDFHALATEIGLDALVEVHDEHELETALACGATLIGVNQRDLVTFQVDHERAVRMGALFPSGITSVAESGVRGRGDAEALRAAGYEAVLVGEHLVTARDTRAALADLLVP